MTKDPNEWVRRGFTLKTPKPVQKNLTFLERYAVEREPDGSYTIKAPALVTVAVAIIAIIGWLWSIFA